MGLIAAIILALSSIVIDGSGNKLAGTSTSTKIVIDGSGNTPVSATSKIVIDGSGN
ncbi:MAG: hypothetical protein JWN78_1422 [Bacteroidota bacterium]|nr:hypothetical protein [Bacteroidota bacterium]